MSYGGVDFGQNYPLGASFRSRLISYFENNVIVSGKIAANFITIANTNRDLTGINYENTNVGDVNNAWLYCIQGTFTGFHRVFTDDELFNNDEPQQFKDDYEGRIVISNGKIATDTTDTGVKDNTDWTT